MKNITLNIKGMHCASCEIIIQESLEAMDGVNSAYLDFKKGTGMIDFDDTKVKDSDLMNVIQREGYEVSK